MEGLLRVRVRPWLRRAISRGLAILPAVAVIVLRGEDAVTSLLLWSQVVLRLQLSFAVVPLVAFTSDRRRMGEFVNPRCVTALAVLVAVTIAALNGKLVPDAPHDAAAGGAWLAVLGLPVAVLLGVLLVYLGFAPWLQRRWPRLVPAASPAVHAVGSRLRAAAPPIAAVGSLAPAVPAIQVGAYRRIAVALEMGGADLAVLEYLRTLSFAAGAELVLVHVVESAASRFLGEQSMDEESREQQETLDANARDFRMRGVAARGVLGHGDAKHEIARLVRAERADRLVTGSHGHTGLRDVVYGTTVSAVRHLVDCQVLTVPSARGVPSRAGREPGPPRREPAD